MKRNASAAFLSSESDAAMEKPVDNQLGEGLWNQAQRGKFTDCTIQCGKKTFTCHKNVLCARSSYFAAAFDGNFQESDSSQLTITDSTPDDVEKLLYFLYTNAIRPEDRSSKWNFPVGQLMSPEVRERCAAFDGLVLSIELYTIGDAFSVLDLKKAALGNFSRKMHAMGTKSMMQMPSITVIIKFIYRSTPSSDLGLRNEICGYLRIRMANDHDRHILFGNKKFLESLEKTNGFALDLLKSIGTHEKASG